MTTNRYVVAPRYPTPLMKDAGRDRRAAGNSEADIYTAMLAAIPDDPNAPVLVERDEWERMKRKAALADAFIEASEMCRGTRYGKAAESLNDKAQAIAKERST